MSRSGGLALYLASRSLVPRKKPVAATQGDLPERPSGEVVWVHAGPGADADAVIELARRIAERRSGASVVLTASAPVARIVDPPLCLAAEPDDNARDVKRFLDHWRPGAVLFAGEVNAPVAMVEIQSRGVPLLLVEARLPDTFARRLRWAPGAGASLFGGVTRILTPTDMDAETFRRLKAPADRVEPCGHLEEGPAPLSCNRRDHAALATLLAARPLWLATGVEAGEVSIVVAAHRRAMRMAHRLLLILSPAQPEGSAALRDALEAEEWAVALRSDGEEPDPGIQIFVADVPGEAGLWYRLAPITFLGGSLVKGAEGRDPSEPAALGSAILTGPERGVFRQRLQRFLAAGAARTAGSADALGEAVADLLAPDRAAEMARRAWEITSAGAELSDRVIALVDEVLDAREPA